MREYAIDVRQPRRPGLSPSLEIDRKGGVKEVGHDQAVDEQDAYLISGSYAYLLGSARNALQTA